MVKHDGSEETSGGFAHRRQILKGLATAGLAGLAGCSTDGGRITTSDGGSGGGDDGGSGTATQTGGEPRDNYLSVQMNTRPDQVNYNPFGKQAMGPLAKIVFEIGAKWYPDEEKWVPLLIEDWEYPSTIAQGETVQFNLHPDTTWVNGDPYTAQDFVGQMHWRKENNDSVWEFIEGVEQTGDHTVEMTFAQKIDTRLFENALIGMGDAPTVWNFKYDVYSDYLERLQDASGSKERNAILQEVSNLNFSLDEAMEKGLANGPFKPKQASATKLILEKNEDYTNPHITADDLNFNLIEGLPIDSPQKKLRSLRNNEADSLHNTAFTSAQSDQVPDHYEGLTYFTHSGGAFCFNCRREPFDNRKVRWALSNVWRAGHATLMQNLPLSDKNKDTVPFSAGMSGPLVEKWLGDRKDDYMHFDGGTERAAELLRGEGFTKENGKWYKPDGEQFTITFKGASFHSNRTQTGAQLLTDFGIETKALVQEPTTWFSKTTANRDYDITNWWVGQSVAIPYQGLFGTLVNSAWVTAYPLGVESVSSWEGESTSEFIVKVPPIGEPEGEPREVNIKERLSKLAAAQTEDEKRPHIQEIAWVWNWMDTYWGPWLLYLASEYYDTKDWQWKDKEDPMMKAPTVQDWPLRLGYPKAKTK
ncbi:ABC transporter substrate-binding protein [Haloferax gibbonsii]|nr:ABC transporter substrate-binding protein [Haloferax gibbonsii]